nr:uncharacterized protein CI109_002792 [Kwoniella shandongensis]KAA5528638.1 hypothetical protein CI109_002792 [Kwoniella shandongensis]
MSSSADGQPDSKKQKRHIPHVSRACDRCRKRKTRCNGAQPVCDVCSERGWTCEYEEEDKRKTNRELEDLKERVALLESIVLANPRSSRPPPSHPLTTSSLVKLTASRETSEEPSRAPSPTTDGGTIAQGGRQIRHLPAQKPVTHGAPSGDLIRNDEEGYERLQRTSNGPLLHYGATSIWTHQSNQSQGPATPVTSTQSNPPPQRIIDGCVDWSRHLPPGLMVDRSVHDAALAHFAAYYAPWCLVVDMPAFFEDMAICNLIGPSGPPVETRTTYYTPLLHCTTLFLGLYLLGGEWPEKLKDRHEEFIQHCTKLAGIECDLPSVSSLRAINLLSTCQNLKPQVTSGSNLGYTYFAMTFGMIQVLGVNINCEPYVKRGRMSEQELLLRDAAYWAIYLQDILRAIAVGRPAFFASSNPPIPYPKIDRNLDIQRWTVPVSSHWAHSDLQNNGRVNGLKSMQSTIFHWTCKLGALLAGVLETLYSPVSDSETHIQSVKHLGPRLEAWYAAQPTPNPASLPLPHVLLMHMTYHLTTIFLYRPFYRDDINDEPSPAERCNRAAKNILNLLQLYDDLHTIRCGPATFINITSTASTIFLLKAVVEQDRGSDMRATVRDIDALISMMRRLSQTWREAEKATEVMISLRAEWLPGIDSHSSTHPPNINNTSVPDSTAGELHEWFMNQDFYQTAFNRQ